MSKCGVEIIQPYVPRGAWQKYSEIKNNCPTNALSTRTVEGQRVLSLDSTRCFSCGTCVRLIKPGAPYKCDLLRPSSRDTKEVSKWIKEKRDFGFLIGPGLEYYHTRINLKQVVTACKSIGAKRVYKTSAAAPAAFGSIKREIIERFNDNIIIDSRCGAVRNYVSKFRTDLVDKLIKSNSTLLESARLARQNDEVILLCFVGPDIAYKEAIDCSKAKPLNAVLTWHEFDELCDYHLDEPISELHESDFDKFPGEGKSKGCIPNSLSFEAIAEDRGIPYTTLADKDRKEVIAFLKKVKNDPRKRQGFIEVLYCRSCIYGPGVFSRWDLEQHTSESKTTSESPRNNMTMNAKEINLVQVGTAGALGVGSHARAHVNDLKMQQVGTRELAQELVLLWDAMRRETEGSAEQEEAIEAVAAAKEAVAQGDGATVTKYLRTAGKWTLGIAEKIGTAAAAEAIKRAIF